MVYYNLNVRIKLLKDINYEDTYEILSKVISYAMLQDSKLKELHEKNTYKNYVFCGIYPIEQDLVYKKEKIYSFDIRFFDTSFALKMNQLLKIIKIVEFEILSTYINLNEQRKISKLISLTPTIITTDKGDYDIKDDMEFVESRIIANTQKKYSNLLNKTTDVNFIKSIKKTNLKPIKLKYKGIYFLGNKFEIEVNEDQVSQDLAYIALSVGLCEKNALGFGFCRAR